MRVQAKKSFLKMVTEAHFLRLRESALGTELTQENVFAHEQQKALAARGALLHITKKRCASKSIPTGLATKTHIFRTNKDGDPSFRSHDIDILESKNDHRRLQQGASSAHQKRKTKEERGHVLVCFASLHVRTTRPSAYPSFSGHNLGQRCDTAHCSSAHKDDDNMIQRAQTIDKPYEKTPERRCIASHLGNSEAFSMYNKRVQRILHMRVDLLQHDERSCLHAHQHSAAHVAHADDSVPAHKLDECAWISYKTPRTRA